MAAATTTIRVDRDVHERLVRLAEAGDQQLMEAVREAVETLERARFAARVGHEVEALRADPVKWAAYLDDGELAVRDGVA